MDGQILDGVRIIEIASGTAVPTAAMLLAESGAEVIKVEPPEGDPLRGTAGFAVWNRSKRSVVLDWQSPDGREKLKQLLDGADVLMHDLSPAEAEVHGLDDVALEQHFPHLIISSIPAFPVNHPDADRVARDPLVLARAGLMDEQRGVNRDGPVYLRMPLGTWGSVYLAASGVVARLYHRERGGSGGPAHTSLLQGALIPMTMHWGRAERPTDNFTMGMPKEMIATVVEASDGKWMHVLGGHQETPLLQQTLKEMGEEEIEKANAAFAESGSRWVADNYGSILAAFKKHPREVWLENMWANDIEVQPCLALGEIYFDEQANINGYVLDVDDPDFGKTRQPGHPYTTSPPSAIKSPAPVLGAHTREVFDGLRTPRTSESEHFKARWPLDGLKVLDFGYYLAGPFAPMMLADLGAEVIKVEGLHGDGMRSVERGFAGCQRGKRNIAIDLKSPDAKQVLEELVKWADVVHHNIRMPAAHRMGIDYESLKAINPELIYCHVSSYGPIGPRANWPGKDQLFQAASGWEYEGAGEGNQPMWHRFGMMDHQCAMASLTATLLALYHREQTGKGQFVAASLLGASILTISERIVNADGALTPFAGLNHDQTGVSDFNRIYHCQDGWFCLIAEEPAQQELTLSALGAQNSGELEDACAAITVIDALSRLEEIGVPCEPVRLDQMNAFFDSPHNQANGLVASYPHTKWGMTDQIGGLWNFGDLGVRLDRASAEFGEHSREIFDELGLSPELFEKLKDEGAIVDGPLDLDTMAIMRQAR